MTVKQSIALVTDPDFGQAVVTYAILRQAEIVYAEAGATPGHALRAALATRVANSPATYTPIFAYLIGAEDSFLGLTVPQGNALALTAAQTRVANVWSLVAGA